MNKKLLAGVIAGVLIIGGAGYYLTQEDDSGSNNQTASSNSETATPADSATKGSIASFLGSDQTKECTYSSTVNGTTVSGTMYFANGQMRNNYKGNKDGKTQDGSMIVTKEAQYIWDNTTKKGMKFAFNPDTTTSNTQSSSSSQQVDVNQEYDFTCKDWGVDNSYFTPPSDVAIQDLSQLQQQLQQR